MKKYNRALANPWKICIPGKFMFQYEGSMINGTLALFMAINRSINIEAHNLEKFSLSSGNDVCDVSISTSIQ